MESKIQMWGNSLALRIPKAYAEQIGLRSNSPVKLSSRFNAYAWPISSLTSRRKTSTLRRTGAPRPEMRCGSVRA
jgi:antitoxin component of MazEF toxin-antitoxin module